MLFKFDPSKGPEQFIGQSIILRIKNDKDQAIESIINTILDADKFKQDQLAVSWPELASALAGLIEITTEYDAPKSWWHNK